MKYLTQLIIIITIFFNVSCSQTIAIKSEIKTSALAFIRDGSGNENIANSDVAEISKISNSASLSSFAFMNYNKGEKKVYIDGTLSKAQTDIFNNPSFIRIEGAVEIISGSNRKSKVTKSNGHASIVTSIKTTKPCYYMIAYTLSYSGHVKNTLSFSHEKLRVDSSAYNIFSSNTDDPKRTDQGIIVGEISAGDNFLHISSDVNGNQSFSKIDFSVIIIKK